MDVIERSFELPMHYAALYRDTTAIRSGDAAFINKEFADLTPLILAVSNANYGRSELLYPLEIYRPIFPNEPDLNTTVLLLERGADVNGADTMGVTPLHRAINDGACLEIITALIEHGANIHQYDIHGKNALHYLTRSSDGDLYKTTRYLLEQGADPFATDIFSVSAIEEAVTNYEVLFGMVDHGVKLTDDRLTSDNQSTLLHYACYEKASRRVLELIVDSGMDVNAQNASGQTPLHMAVSEHRVRYDRVANTVRALLRHSPDVSQVDHLGQTPLHYLNLPQLKIIDDLFASVVAMLVDAGVDVNQHDIFGRTTLCAGLLSAKKHRMEALIRHGGNTGEKDKHGASIIHYACLSKDLSSFIAPESVGCDNYGSSLLHYAAYANNEEAIHKLLQVGLQVNLTDEAGETPLDVAIKFGYQSIARHLGGNSGKEVIRPGYICQSTETKLHWKNIERGDFQPVVQPGDTAEFSQMVLSSRVFGKCQHSTEVEDIKTEVLRLLSRLAMMVERKFPFLAFVPKLRGSMAEGTKCGFPDEFDVMLQIHRLAECFDAEMDHSVGRNKYTRLRYNHEDGGFLQSTYPYLILEDGDLNSNLLNYVIYNTIFSIFMDSDLWVGSRLSFVDFVGTTNFLMVKLVWTSCGFKNLEIDVDLVPCIPISFDFTTLDFLWNLPINLDEACLYALLVYSNVQEKSVQFEVSFSDVEQLMMSSIPQAALDAYIFAKVLRNPKICPLFEDFDSFDDGAGSFPSNEPWAERANVMFSECLSNRSFGAENLIKSYYLKCALFHIVYEKAKCVDIEKIECHQWTRWIYQSLRLAAETHTLTTYIQHHNVLGKNRDFTSRSVVMPSNNIWKMGRLCDPAMFHGMGYRGSDDMLKPVSDEILEKYNEQVFHCDAKKLRLVLKVICFLLRVADRNG